MINYNNLLFKTGNPSIENVWFFKKIWHIVWFINWFIKWKNEHQWCKTRTKRDDKQNRWIKKISLAGKIALGPDNKRTNIINVFVNEHILSGNPKPDIFD